MQNRFLRRGAAFSQRYNNIPQRAVFDGCAHSVERREQRSARPTLVQTRQLCRPDWTNYEAW